MTDDQQPRERTRGDQGDWRPRPDPTALTTEALNREIRTITQLIEQQIQALEDLTNAKFSTVNTQFMLFEAQRVEQKADTQKAVQDALAAAKEIVREQSANFKEQLTQITLTFSTALSGLTKQVDDMKERVAKIEAIKIGGNEAKTGIYAMVGFVATLLIIGSMLAAAGVFGRQ